MKIIIKDLIPDKRNHLDTYIMHVKCTHGDDTVSTHRQTFSGKSDMILVYQYVEFFISLKGMDMTNPIKVTKFVNSKAVELKTKYSGTELAAAIIPQDRKYLGMLATVSLVWLTYFDENGHEHFVDIEHECDIGE